MRRITWHLRNASGRVWLTAWGILRGIEANIKNINGEIDCSGKMFISLDLIIAGFVSDAAVKKPIPRRDDRDHRQRQSAYNWSPGSQSIQWRLARRKQAAAGHHVAAGNQRSASFLHSRKKGSE